MTTMITLKDNGKFQIFHKQSVEFFNQCGVPGKAINSGVRRDHVFPNMFDKLPDRDGNPSTFDAFEHIPASGATDAAFTKEGFSDYKRAVQMHGLNQNAFEKHGNAKITEYLNQYLSTDVKLQLASHQPWLDACNKPVTDNFGKYRILQKMYSQGTGKTKNRELGNWLNTKQNNDSCAKFLDAVKTGEEITRANYESKAFPGHIALADLTGAIVLNGLNVGFKSFLENYYLDNPTGLVVDLPALLKSAALYAREQIEEVPPDQYAAALTAILVKYKCIDCDAPIEALNKFGKPFKCCLPCTRNRQSKQFASRADKPGPVIPKQSTAAKTSARANVAASHGESIAPVGGHITLDTSDSDED